MARAITQLRVAVAGGGEARLEHDLGAHPGELAEGLGEAAVVTDRQPDPADVRDVEGHERRRPARTSRAAATGTPCGSGATSSPVGREDERGVVDAAVLAALVHRARHEPEPVRAGDLGRARSVSGPGSRRRPPPRSRRASSSGRRRAPRGGARGASASCACGTDAAHARRRARPASAERRVRVARRPARVWSAAIESGRTASAVDHALNASVTSSPCSPPSTGSKRAVRWCSPRSGRSAGSSPAAGSRLARISFTPLHRRDVVDLLGDVGLDLRVVDEVHERLRRPAGSGAPTGISMLVDHSMQPSFGITNLMFGLSFWSWTASPDQPSAIATSPLARSRM